MDGCIVKESTEFVRLQEQVGVTTCGSSAQAAGLRKSVVMIVGERDQSLVTLRHVIPFESMADPAR
jgi:hypothetical protein